jgi:hypothetical protein
MNLILNFLILAITFQTAESLASISRYPLLSIKAAIQISREDFEVKKAMINEVVDCYQCLHSGHSKI